MLLQRWLLRHRLGKHPRVHQYVSVIKLENETNASLERDQVTVTAMPRPLFELGRDAAVCPANQYNPVSGATSCTSCPTGSTSSSGASTCACSAGYSTSGTGSSLACTGTVTYKPSWREDWSAVGTESQRSKRPPSAYRMIANSLRGWIVQCIWDNLPRFAV